MSIADKLTTIAENEQKVYDAGAKSEYDRFWDAYQNNGKSMWETPNAFSFGRWNDTNFFPKHDIVVGSGDQRSYFYRNAVTNLRERIDGRGLKVVLSTSTPNLHMWFREAATTELPDMDTHNIKDFAQFAYLAAKVHTIPRLNLTNATNVTNAFTGATALQNITFEGTIPISISFKDCTLLTHESLMSIIDHLYDYASEGSTTTYTLTLGTINLVKLSEEEQAIAIQKGWTLA